MERYSTPTLYGNLYDAETPPFDINDFINIPSSQQSTQSWDSRNGPRSASPASPSPPSLRPMPSPPALPRDSLLEASNHGPPPLIPDSQAESSESQSSSGSNDSQFIRATECSRDKRIQIQTALLFRIPHAEIKRVLDVTDYQIW